MTPMCVQPILQLKTNSTRTNGHSNENLILTGFQEIVHD